MAIERLRGKIAGSVCAVGLFAALAGCSGSEPSPGAGQAGGGGAGGSGSSPGGSGASPGVSGGSAIPDVPVGAFQVEMTVPNGAPDTWRTAVIGKVNDGATPQSILWETTRRDGDCWVEEPRAPFCSEGCGADVCVDDDFCLGYPEAHSVGEVKLSGVRVAGGGSELILKEIAKAYQPAAGVMFEEPPFAEGDAIELTASGGDYTAFELSSFGVAPLDLTSADFELAVGKALELTWNAASDPQRSAVHLKLDISHHGGSRGLLECETADDGSLSVSAELVSALIGLGFAGFPTMVVTRSSRNGVELAPGRVELVVSSRLEQAVTIEGLISCSGSEPEPGAPPECPEGTTCQSDLTCQ